MTQPPQELSLRELAGPIAAFAVPLLLCVIIVLVFQADLILLGLDAVLLAVLALWAVRRVKTLERTRQG